MKNKNLAQLMQWYIDHALASQRHDPTMLAHSQICLIGTGLPGLHIGYIEFLNSCGIADPCIGDLSNQNIGLYFEYLLQHHGAIRTDLAVKILRIFWDWCHHKRLITGETPADLGSVGLPYVVRLETKIKH